MSRSWPQIGGDGNVTKMLFFRLCLVVIKRIKHVDGQNPFRTTLKAWGKKREKKLLFVGIYGEIIIQGFLRWCRNSSSHMNKCEIRHVFGLHGSRSQPNIQEERKQKRALHAREPSRDVLDMLGHNK